MGKKITTEEFIAKATKVHNGRYSYDNTVYKGSSEKVIITCKVHGDFQQRPGDHLNGFGCSECSGNYKMNTERFIQRAKDKFGDKFDYSKVDYKNNSTNVTISCPIHGWFEQTPGSHLRYAGCKQCSRENSVMTTEEFITKAKIVHGDKYGYDNTTYKGSTEKVTITCKTHGDFQQVAGAHLSGYNCPYCGKNGKDTLDEFITKANKTHHGKYNYSKVVMGKSSEKVEIICPIHGSFFQLRGEHISGYGCRKCGNSEPLTTEEYIKRCKKTHGDKYDYSKTIYKNLKGHVTVICKIHGEFDTIAGNHANGSGCPKCTTIGRYANVYGKEKLINGTKEIYDGKVTLDKIAYKNMTSPIKAKCVLHGEFDTTPQLLLRGHGCPKCGGSSGEIAISSVLDKYGIEYKRELRVTIDDKQYRYDFYIPIINMLLEFHGGQHYIPVKIWGGEHGFKKRQASDKIKEQYAKKNGYTFAVLNHLDLDNIEEVLKKKLTDICKYWFIKDDEMVATNSLVYIGRLYNIPGNVLVRDTLSYLGIKLLF